MHKLDALGEGRAKLPFFFLSFFFFPAKGEKQRTRRKRGDEDKEYIPDAPSLSLPSLSYFSERARRR